MKPKVKAEPKARVGKPFKDRMGLGAYIFDPTSYPPSRVIYHTPDFVAIHDKFPKATIHTLLLPRSSKHNLSHPFDALEDDDFRAKLVAETEKLKGLVARELERIFGRQSKADAKRQAILDGEAEPEGQNGLPPGRDWAGEVISGIHAVPSMGHLHIHVLSRDMHSPCLKYRNHYNSFTTPFLVDIKDFPLKRDDPRRNTKKERYLEWDMRCWRCERNFKYKFKELKEHLEEEWNEWKRE